MPYIGNQPQYTSFLSDTFSGNGVTTAFSLRVAPANTAAVIVAIWGILQSPDTYSVVGNILTFSQAPPAGTDNISVRYLSLPASNVVNSAYRSVTDITATAGQTTFSTSSYTPGFVEVFRNGVRLGVSNFTATSGVTVVLGNPANAGDLVTVVSFFVSSVINAIPGTAGSVTANNLDTSQQGGAGAMILPTGSTGQRPISPVTGMTRFNTSIGGTEIYNGTRWLSGTAQGYAIDILLVAGGGSGGQGSGNYGGGGGAGGLIFIQNQGVVAGTAYSMVVGAGGPQQTTNTAGNPGSNTTGFGYTALGGGGGGTQNIIAGQPGGSGGGGGYNLAGGAATQPTSAPTGGPYQLGFGNAGGAGNTSPNGGGGGGGAGAVGFTNSPCNGGAGLNMSFWFGTTYGASGWFAGGGGGTNQAGFPTPAGGQGGGGTGTVYNQSTQTAGTDGTGGGGGGGGSTLPIGRAGGSGIVLIRYEGAQRATGGTITSSNGFTIHAFTGSGTFIA